MLRIVNHDKAYLGEETYTWFFQFSCSAVSDSLQPHGLQHARLPCPSPITGACSDSCPSSQWCHPIISSSVIPFSFCLQSSPGSGFFPRSQFFASGGQSIRVSASASVLPMNIQDWGLISFTVDWFELLVVQGTLKSFLQHDQFKSINSWIFSYWKIIKNLLSSTVSTLRRFNQTTH